MRFAFVLLLLVGCDSSTQPITIQPSAPITGKVVAVLDGDTLDVLINNQPRRIRLNGIDAPEKGQPFGNNAKQSLSDLTFGKSIEVVDHGSDRYGRILGDVISDGRPVNLELVARGMAWHYTDYSDDAQLAAAEANARTEQLGLWSDQRSVAPWAWRKLSKAERDKLR